MRANQRAPALQALFFFAAGIVGATRLEITCLLLLWATAAVAVGALLAHLFGRQPLRRAAICIALLLAGCCITRLQLADFPANHISHFTDLDRELILTGELVSEPDIRPSKTFLTVSVDSILVDDLAIDVCGDIRLRINRPTSRFNFRDRIRFSGRLTSPPAARNPGEFDYHRYLLIRNIHGLVSVASADRVSLLRSGAAEPFVRNLIVPVREHIVGVFERFLSRSEAAVMRGFLMGDVRHISPTAYRCFKDTGTLHVLAASGANVAYVVATVFVFLRLLGMPRKYKYLLALAAIFIFSFLAYNQPSVVRASLMAATGLVGFLLFRDLIPLNVISFSALLILAFRPLYLFDAGFQLSYAAAFGLVIFMPEINRRLRSGKGRLRGLLRWPLSLIAVTVTAQIWVLPVLLHYFHVMPLVSFLSNLAVVPLVGLATSVGIVLVLVAELPLVGWVVGLLLSWLLSTTLTVIGFFTALPVPRLCGPALPFPAVVAYYAGLLTLASLVARRRAIFNLLTIILVALNALVWQDLVAGSAAAVEMVILDTAPATTIFLRQATGSATLLQTGGNRRSPDLGQRVVAPALLSRGVRSVERILTTDSSAANIEAIRSITSQFEGSMSCFSPGSLAARDLSEPIETVAPLIGVGIGDVAVALILGPVTAQQLSNLPDSVDIVTCGRGDLSSINLDQLIDEHGVNVLIITDYSGLANDYAQLARLRAKHPNCSVLSVFESGAVIVTLAEASWQLLPTIGD